LVVLAALSLVHAALSLVLAALLLVLAALALALALAPVLTTQFKIKLTGAMVIDFVLCWVMEKGCKALFADLEPAELVTRGQARRIKRRAEQERAAEAKKVV
jgi:membrane protein implicated in regulation of membrane protease activity